MLYNPQLDTLIAVVETGSFTKASNELFISPQAVIKQINQLEERLGFTLFERTQRGVKLTPVGDMIYREALFLVRHNRDVLNRAQDMLAYGQHDVRLGISPITSGRALLEMWVDVLRYAPDLQLKVESIENSAESARAVILNLGEQVDVIVGLGLEPILQTGKVHFEPIGQTKPALFLAPDHPLAKAKSLRLEDLVAYRVWGLKSGMMTWNDKLQSELKDLGGQVQQIDFYNLEVFNRCMGTTDIVLGVEGWKHIHPAVTMVPLASDLLVTVGVYYSPEPSQAVLEMLKALRTIMKLRK